MSNKIRDFKIGIFVFVGLFFFIFFLYIASGNESLFRSTSSYKITVQNSKGLFEGSFISINGIKAGNISKIEMVNNKIILTLNIRKKYSKFINQSSVATKNTKGLLGDKYISIKTLKEAPSLEEGSFLQYNKGIDILEIISSHDELLVNISTFFNEASKFLSKINKAESDGKLIHELSTITKQARKIFSKENNQEIKKILKHTKNILKKIDTGKGSVGILINDKDLYNQIYQFFDREESGFLNLFMGSKKKKKKSKKQ